MSFHEFLSRTAILAAPADTTDLAPLRAAVFAGLRAGRLDAGRRRARSGGHRPHAVRRGAARRPRARRGLGVRSALRSPRPKLNGYARRRLSGAAAADAVQESFLVLFEKAATMLAHHEVNVAGFLFGVLRNMMRRVLARHARETVMEDPAEDEHASRDEGLVTLLHQEEREHLAEIVERTCNPLEQEVLAMIIDGHRGPEIAATLGIEPEHVRVLRHRAAAMLRKALAEEGAT